MSLIPYIDPEGDATVEWRDPEVEHWPDGWVPVFSVTDIRVLARIVSNLIPPPAPPAVDTIDCLAGVTVKQAGGDDGWRWQADTPSGSVKGHEPTMMSAVMSGVRMCNEEGHSRVRISTPTEEWTADTPLVPARGRRTPVA